MGLKGCASPILTARSFSDERLLPWIPWRREAVIRSAEAEDAVAVIAAFAGYNMGHNKGHNKAIAVQGIIDVFTYLFFR